MITHVTLELRTLPAQVLEEPTLLGVIAHERAEVVLEEWRKVLGRQVVEDLDEQEECLSKKGEGGVGWEGLSRRGREELVDMLEELEVGLAEAVEDKVDLGEELVGAELMPPAVVTSALCLQV